jgi:hypothetical protein
MKSSKILLACMAAGITFLYSCQKEITQDPSQLKSAAGDYIEYSEDEVCLGDEVTVVFNNGYNNNCGNAQLQVSTDGGVNWTQVASGVPVDGQLVYTFEPPTAGSYLFRARWNATGGPSCSNTGSNIGFMAGTATFPIVVHDDCCELGFSGSAISCDDTREAVYIFTADEALDYIKIQGGLTNFTGSDAEVIVSGGDLSVSQWTPGGSSNRVIRLEGSIESCETVTITIRWNSSNGGEVITGNWSVKDAQGEDIAPSIDGLICQ